MKYKTIKGEIRSPLRYPGGKNRAVKKILPLIPLNFKEFRGPFVGGGSVFIATKQRVKSQTIFKINDLNTDLYCFWKIARDENQRMVQEVRRIKEEHTDGRELSAKLEKEEDWVTEFDKAVRFFILNRITFSGLSDSGGYSEQAFNKRFTDSSIDRLERLEKVLQGVEVYNTDYSRHLEEPGEKVFIFLDPPYVKSAKKKLYGKNGDLHLEFDPRKFAKDIKKCEHTWMITYDNCELTRDLFDFANIYEWELQYGMNNWKQKKAKKGQELFITNYDLEKVKNTKNQSRKLTDFI